MDLSKISVRFQKALNKIEREIQSLKKRFLRKFASNSIDEIMVEDLKNTVKIISAEDTLATIENFIDNNKKGVYMRFGDGDIFLSKNIDDGFQKSNPIMTQEMQETLSLQGHNVLKCLRIHSELFGFSEGMVPGNHKNKDKFALQLFKDSYKYFVGSNIYSPVALHFMANQNPDKANQFLKKLKSKTKLFIGNENVQEATRELLFGKNVVHIKTPSENAYSDIDRIENEVTSFIEKLEEYAVIVVAMGCSGRPLMKRIWKQNKNIFIFDFGSLLDGIEGNNSRTWLKINSIDYTKLLKDL